jgi:hypothetical protein
MALWRYRTTPDSDWVVQPIELSVPVPRAPDGTTEVEVQHAQANTETTALPTDSSMLALLVPDRPEPTQSRFEPPPPVRPWQYRTVFPSNYVVQPVEPSLPTQGGTTDVEVQHAQANTETTSLPTDSSTPALPVPDRPEPTQSRFEPLPPVRPWQYRTVFPSNYVVQPVEPPPPVRTWRYRTVFPSNYVVQPVEPSLPTQGGTTDAEIQYAQANTETAALPTDSSTPALAVPDRIEPTQSRFEPPPTLPQPEGVTKPPQVRRRYASIHPPTWTKKLRARFVNRDGPEIDDGASPGGDEASSEPPDCTGQYESTLNPRLSTGAPALGKDPADPSGTVRLIRLS